MKREQKHSHRIPRSADLLRVVYADFLKEFDVYMKNYKLAHLMVAVESETDENRVSELRRTIDLKK